MWNWQQFVSFIRTLKGRKREQAAFAIAAVCFPSGYAVGGKLLPDFKDGLDFLEYVQISLYLVGVACLAYTAFRVWRLAHPPELPPAKDRPSAIKGPMAFTEADGELFRKLGRESELQKLLGLVLDDQVLMIVVRGASGAGKTSLLRAGLKHILGNHATFHYWEAVPTEPDKGFLRAIQEKWPEGASRPASLDELVNPADALGRQSHVIVLDQFEQLRGSRKMFSLLRRIVRESRPPHRITWVIAFRREFSADWMDFISPELERGLERGFRPPQDVSLRLFTADQAREVIGQLVNESNLKDSIEQSVINNLIEAATVESEVSPVDIGIGLLVLAELHERQSGQTITIRDYQFAGGAEGLLTQYISRCLELFPKESQEAILKAMLALRDAETNQRLAEGLTVDELAAESGAEARLLKTQLDRLSHRDTRLLETVTPADGSPTRYRLPHERLIPALYRLTGKLLAEVDQAKLKFQNAFQAWKTNDKRRHYLLKAKELRLVERYETQIPWGNDEQEKKNFLRISQRRRMFIKGAAVATIIAVTVISWASYLQYQRSNGESYLSANDYPPSLYDWQHRLKKVELIQPLNLERFTWLSSNSLEELSLKASSSSNSIAGLASLARCRSLKKLTLNLNGSHVTDLKPLSEINDLSQLTLYIDESHVGDLAPLIKLKKLDRLTLYLSEQNDNELAPLSKLSSKTHLVLYLKGRLDSDSGMLPTLDSLCQLIIDPEDIVRQRFSGTSSYILPNPKLAEFSFDPGISLESNWLALTKLPNFFASESPSDLGLNENPKLLQKLRGLDKITLRIPIDDIYNWWALSELRGPYQIALDFRATEEKYRFLLERITAGLSLIKSSDFASLALALRGDQIADLELLSKLGKLTQLTFDLRERKMVTIY